MPKKNKPGRNGFFYFMMEFKDRQGRKFRSMVEASEAAGEVWKKMGPAERSPYNERAVHEKDQDRGGAKLTALHENIDVLKHQEQQKKDSEKQMHLDIDKIIKRAMNTNSLEKQYFYIMHINNFCYSNSDNRYFPAEIAVLKFNLEEGVLKENIYHEIVRPGSLPLGYSFKAKQTSNETHQLPPPIGETDSNMQDIIEEIISFMDASSEEITRIYVHDKQLKLVSDVMIQMCNDNDIDPSCFKFYSLQYLLFAINNGICENVWPNVNQSIIELERDVYDFTTGISCAFHEDSDVPVHCSKSIVTRYAFIICDNCSTRLDIKLIPGQHIPCKSLFRGMAEVAPSVSSYRSAKNRPPSVCSNASSMFTDGGNSEYLSAASQDDDDGEWSEPHSKSRKKKFDQSQSTFGNSSGASASQESRPYSQSVSSGYEPLRRPTTKSASVLDPLSFSNMQPGRGRARPKF